VLPLLFGSVLAPPAVVREFRAAPDWLVTTSVPDPTLAAALALVLGPGEAEAIALAAELKCRVVLDDHQTRATAARLQVEVIGTVGILLRAKLSGVVSEVAPLLQALEQAGFRIDTRLRLRALELAEETTGSELVDDADRHGSTGPEDVP
jgi:predicted nucleic acid-binding protein